MKPQAVKQGTHTCAAERNTGKKEFRPQSLYDTFQIFFRTPCIVVSSVFIPESSGKTFKYTEHKQYGNCRS